MSPWSSPAQTRASPVFSRPGILYWKSSPGWDCHHQGSSPAARRGGGEAGPLPGAEVHMTCTCVLSER